MRWFPTTSGESLVDHRSTKLLKGAGSNIVRPSYNRGMSVADISEYVTSIQAARIVRKSRNQVLKYVRDGLLPGIRLGQHVLIPRDALRNFQPPPRGNPGFRRRK